MKNKNILFIAHMDVYPCKHGGHVEIFYSVKSFAQKCNAFLAIPTLENIEKAKNKYKPFNIHAIPYMLDTTDNYLKYPLSLFSKLTFKFCKFYRKKFMLQLCNVIKENNIDTVFCYCSQTSNYALELKKRFPDLKIYLREQNIEYKLVKQYAKGSKNLLMKFIAYFEYFKTKRYELDIWKKFDKVFFISDTDLEIAKKYKKDFDDTNLIYSGMSYPEISNYNVIKEEEKTFLFTGALTSYQNQRNLKYFIDNIWVPFLKKEPNAKLFLTGNSDEYLSKRLGVSIGYLQNINVINMGFTDDLENIILSKKYFISPTLYGSGIRIKVLKGLSLSKVVFVTDIDYKMVHHFKDMENIVHYSNFSDFYNKYLQLENNPELFNSIKENGHKLLKYFSWDEYTNKAMKIINDVEE